MPHSVPTVLITSVAGGIGRALAPQGMNVLTVHPGPTRTAHACRYSPDNSREARRIPPEDLAAAVVQAVTRRQRILVPGTGNQRFAGIGRWLPALDDWAMRKTSDVGDAGLPTFPKSWQPCVTLRPAYRRAHDNQVVNSRLTAGVSRVRL